MVTAYKGGCLCGEVRWAASAEPANVRICHCRLCQEATGGPFFARAIFLSDTIQWSGAVVRKATSPRVDRLSCAGCGTPIFAEPKDPPARLGVSLATLDEPGAIRPTAHIWTRSKRPGVVIDDGLPQHPEGYPGP